MRAEATALASEIAGWMELPELEWLYDQALSRRFVVEIGSWKGRSTKALAAATPGCVYAVDTWAGSEGFDAGAYKSEIDRIGPEGIYQEFLKNLAPEIAAGKVVPVRMTSGGAAAMFEKLLLRFDMAFIDANHDVESVRQDIRLWKPLLAPGGLLSGHDYAPRNPGVMQAVDELIPEKKVMENGTIWYTLVP